MTLDLARQGDSSRGESGLIALPGPWRLKRVRLSLRLVIAQPPTADGDPSRVWNRHSALWIGLRTQRGAHAMQTIDVQDYARQLLEAHGFKAIAEAARKASVFEQQGDDAQAQTWRRIEAALMQMRGPHES